MTVSFKEASSDGNIIANSNTLYYSTDKTIWKTLSSENENTEPINAGEKIYFKGNCVLSESGQGIGNFVVSKKYNAAGNAMSLLFADSFIGKTDLTGYNSTFYNLFKNCTTIQSAENLMLPATILTEGCYCMMFSGCTSLTSAPALPATTMAEGCYNAMFQGCTSLITAPELSATVLAGYCCGFMFQNCTSLTTAPKLPATTLAKYCYSNMFQGCTGLTSAPELPATTLVDYCYYYMFYGCTSLTSAPALPATTLANACYCMMFSGCTSLTSAPELPATILVERCYDCMFEGCTSLTSAPVLPATTLTERCYFYMFNMCTNLNYIKMLATDISATDCLTNWVRNVSSTGTFVKNANATENFGPSGWTVQTA